MSYKLSELRPRLKKKKSIFHFGTDVKCFPDTLRRSNLKYQIFYNAMVGESGPIQNTRFRYLSALIRPSIHSKTHSRRISVDGKPNRRKKLRFQISWA